MHIVIYTVIYIIKYDFLGLFLTFCIKNRLTASMPSAEICYIYSVTEPSVRITLAAIGAATSDPKPPSLTHTTNA